MWPEFASGPSGKVRGGPGRRRPIGRIGSAALHSPPDLPQNWNVMSDQHPYITYDSPTPSREVVRDLAAYLLNYYLRPPKALSRKQLSRLPPARIGCFTAARDGSRRTEWESEPISIGIFERELVSGKFDFQKLKLFDPRCDWLDASVTVSPGFHAVDSDGKALTIRLPTNLGDRFPIVPLIDREGTAINSPQIGIQQRILALRSGLVAGSAQYARDEWFHDLRQMISECVTLIDVTLHQAFYRAKYDRPIHWSFDEARIGPTHGVRVGDKLGWIFKITGKHIDATKDLEAFHRIRVVRNHLQHFDPPCFCFTMEDAVGWLNDVLGVARVARGIRRALGSSLSAPFVELLLARPVRFSPEDPARSRLPQAAGMGYGSSRWP